jgi:hypothetical protein
MMVFCFSRPFMELFPFCAQFDGIFFSMGIGGRDRENEQNIAHAIRFLEDCSGTTENVLPIDTTSRRLFLNGQKILEI